MHGQRCSFFTRSVGVYHYFKSMEGGTGITQIMIAVQSHDFLTEAPFETCTYENNGTSFYCNIDLSSTPSSG